MTGKKRKKVDFNGIRPLSKIFVTFLIFLFFTATLEKESLYQRYVTAIGYYQKERQILLDNNIKTVTPKPALFDWSVEKVDEHITKISLPPDPRMSSAEELFEAMNNYRKSHNLSILSKNDLLCSIADNRAKEQLANGELDNHAGFSKYAQNQQEFVVMGEVLFGGSQPQYGVHIVEYGWDRSLTGHKEAIQDPSWQYGCGGIAGYFAVFIFGVK